MNTLYFINMFIVALLVLDNMPEVSSQCNIPPIKSCVKGMKPLRNRFGLFKVLGTIIFCDSYNDGGGWFVFQRRLLKPTVVTSFDQPWQKYKFGFGHLCNDNWWGLEKLYNVTNRPNQRYQLRIFLKSGQTGYEAIYNNFKLDSEMNDYKLMIGEHRGNLSNDFQLHNGAKFSTHDRDNEMQCACYFQVGWWYNRCYNVNLNGKMGVVSPATGAAWDSLTKQNISITYIEMSYRPMTV
ncbi:hypothetical protein Btru_033549 [Bulinus truncatus]|nr:hypothetical protein Btru_033549 [Bulinus truncatus]